jgi:hypothetical protein
MRILQKHSNETNLKQRIVINKTEGDALLALIFGFDGEKNIN